MHSQVRGYSYALWRCQSDSEMVQHLALWKGEHFPFTSVGCWQWRTVMFWPAVFAVSPITERGKKKATRFFWDFQIGINEELSNTSAASLLNAHAHYNRNLSNQTKQSHCNLRILLFPQYSHLVHNYPVEFQYWKKSVKEYCTFLKCRWCT